MPPSTPDVARAIEARVRRDGSRPLLVMASADGRVELSARTAANWADKITHYLDSEGAATVRLDLARTHPWHWLSAVWLLGCWQAGAVVDLRPGAAADVAVTGPDGDGSDAPAWVACSLHPLGLPLGALPAGAVDMAELRGYPDAHLRLPHPGGDAVVDEAGALAWGQLGADPRADRLAIAPPSARSLATRLADAAGAGSLVLCGPGVDVAAAAAAEKAVAA